MPPIDALENRWYARKKTVATKTSAQKNAPIPKDERAFFRSCDGG
jgi:hypothetical protein